MTSFKAGLMACAVKGGGPLYKRIKVRFATRENGILFLGIKRRPITHLSDSCSIFIHPSFYIQPKKKFKKKLYSATAPVPSRLTVLLSDSDISPRLHRLKPYISHTLPFTPTLSPHQPHIIFNPSGVQTCLRHKPSMLPPIHPSLLPCQENHLTTPLLWHTRFHMPAPSSHHRRPGPASTPRPCHL